MTPRFLLFKASAGSGKTFNLAIQYIALLLAHGEHEYRRTLAVTFTNKATAEMKDRILQFLYNFWKGQGRPGDFEACKQTLRKDYGLTLTDEELRQRCRRALRAILHDYSRFYVSTIDAFFQSVLRNMAHELGLNARLQVDLNDKDVIELAVENLIDNLRHDNRDVLPWLRDYIEQQLDEGRSWDVRRELKRMARLLFQEEFLKRSLTPENKPFTIPNIADFKKAMMAEKKRWLEPVQQEAEACERVVLQTGMAYEELCNYSGYVRKYIESLKEGDLTVNFNSYLQDMVCDSQKVLKSALRKDASLQPVAQMLSEGLDRLSQLQRQAAQKINSIDLALANLTPMGLLGAIDREVSNLCNERNRFMLARTPIMLKRMIQGEDAPFVFERIGTRYENIMIDEFQDTSRLQWENFRVLLLDNLSSGGLSMVVGDIKQSIYRWRNGDWRILHELETQGHRGIPLDHRPLADNFRSLGNIVTFNNRLFPLAAQTLDSLDSQSDISLSRLYADVGQGIRREPASGYVRLRICHTKDKTVATEWPEQMLADLCRQVEALHQQGLPYAQMTILLRKNRYIAPTIAYFAQHMPQVPLVSNEAFLLGASVAVNMLMCALQVVDDKERDPVALYYLAQHYQCDVQGQPTSPLPPSTDYLQCLPEAFGQRLEELRHLPLYELCETLYRLLELHRLERQDAYLFTFFDELANYLRDNPSDIPTFLQYWAETLQQTAIPNGEVEGIRIYTIHKSKGLAFHTVLMPFAEWDIEKDRKDSFIWCQPQEPPLNGMGLLPIASVSRAKESVFRADYLEEHANRRADELNDLYVAFTRPKANLYVWGLSQQDMVPENYNIGIADLLHECLQRVEGITCTADDDTDTLTNYTLGIRPDTTVEEAQPHGEINVVMCSYEGQHSFRQSGGATDFVARLSSPDAPQEKDGEMSYLEQGKLLHYIFSQIHTADDIESVTRRMALQGILTSDKQLQRVRGLAERGLRHERVREWFSGRFRLFNECNILVPDPQTGKLLKRRPDRVMMDDERIIIVDFKFGTPKPEYHDQVREYIRILQDMYPRHQVEGWLWYVYKNKVEEIRD